MTLAERVGISHPGVLRYFGTKEALLRAVMERRFSPLDALAESMGDNGILWLLTMPAPDEPEVLTRLATVLTAENLDPGDPLHDYFQDHNRRYRALIADAIRISQARGEVREDIDPDVKAAEIVAFSIGIETQWLLDPAGIDREAVQRSFTESLLATLAAPKRRAATKRGPPPSSRRSRAPKPR